MKKESQGSFSGSKNYRTQIFTNQDSPQKQAKPIFQTKVPEQQQQQKQSDIHHLQPQPQQQPKIFTANQQFNTENIPRVVCHYHQDQFVTLFCRHPSCYMPLCTQCVKIHSLEHQQFNSYGQFDTLENCLNEAYHKLLSYCNRFSEEINQVNLNQGITGDGINVQIDKLQKAKQQAYTVIDTFFSNMEQELQQEIRKNHDFLKHQSMSFKNYLETRQNSLVSQLDKLNSDKCVKNLIKYFCQNVEEDNELYFKESQNFMKQFQKQSPQVVIDQPGIYQMSLNLAVFVSLKKGHNQPLKKEFDSFDGNLIIDQNKQTNTSYLNASPLKQPGVYPITFREQYDGLENRPPKVEEIHPYLRTPPKNKQQQEYRQNNNSTSKQNPPIFYPPNRQGQY